ncbi:MAG: cation diffusion facilitator family transporter [Candidatus Kapaibacteriales bacterium]
MGKKEPHKSEEESLNLSSDNPSSDDALEDEVNLTKSHHRTHNQHYHHHHHHHHFESQSGLKLAFFLNLAFAIIEIIGGILTNSVAIISDAVHDLGDASAIGLAWFLEGKSQKESNQKYTYGYSRLNTIGALVTCLILLIGSIFILQEAIPRLFMPEEVDGIGMIWLAVLGVAINGFAMVKLLKQAGDSVNRKAIALHLMEDVLGWVAVLVGSIIIYFTDWFIIDPILSIGVSLFILYNVFKMLKEIYYVLLQTAPSDLDYKKLLQNINDVAGVESVHDLHVWTLDSNYYVLTAHLVVSESTSPQELNEIKTNSQQIIKSYGIKHATLELELPDEDCEHKDCI